MERLLRPDHALFWEASHVRRLDRVDRMLLVLFLAVWWLTHLAASCLHNGRRARYDRHDHPCVLAAFTSWILSGEPSARVISSTVGPSNVRQPDGASHCAFD